MEPYPALPSTAMVAGDVHDASTQTAEAHIEIPASTDPSASTTSTPAAEFITTTATEIEGAETASSTTVLKHAVAPLPILGSSQAQHNRGSSLTQNMNVDQLLPGLRRLAVQVSRGQITEEQRQSLRSELVASLTSPDGWRESELIGYTKDHRRRQANAGIDEKKGDEHEDSSDESSSEEEEGSSETGTTAPPLSSSASVSAANVASHTTTSTSAFSSTSLAVAAARTGPGRATTTIGDSQPPLPRPVSGASTADDENDGFKFVMLSPNLCRALTPTQYGGGFVTIKFPEGATRADLKKLVLQRFANEPGAQGKTRAKSPNPGSSKPTAEAVSQSPSSISAESKTAKVVAPRRKKRMHRLPPGPPIPVFDPEDFSYNQIIGQGGYATVLRATHKKTQQVYAIKIVRKSSVHAKKTRMYLERNILGLLDSPFIVKIHGFFEDKTFMAHVLQLVTGGSFYDVEKRLRGGMFSSSKGLPEPLVCFYAAELCVALDAMHNRGVVFRDLKPDNILLDADGHLMIIDMGVAYMASEDRKQSIDFDARKLARCTTIVGAHGFRAPEMFDKHGKYGVSVDWWNYGLILYLLFSGKHPLEHTSRWKAAMVGLANRDREAAAADKLVIKPLKRVSAHAMDLVDKLLDRNPLTRIGSVDDADEIMAHPFFKDLDWDRIRTRADPPPIDSKYTKAAKMDSGVAAPSHTYKEVLQSISIWEDDLISGL